MKWRWRWIAIGGIVVTAAFAVASLKSVEYQHNRQLLAAEMQRIRERGDPLDGSELNSYYVLPTDVTDRTSSYVVAFRRHLNGTYIHPSPAPGLPYVHSTTPPPHRPTQWRMLQEAEAYLKECEEMLVPLHVAVLEEGAVRYPADFRNGLVAEMRHLTAIQRICRVFQLEIVCRYHRSDCPAATDSLLAIIRLAETLKYEPTRASQRTRCELWHAVRDSLAFLVADEEFPEAELTRIASMLGRQDLTKISLLAAIGERALTTESLRSSLGTLKDDFSRKDGYPIGWSRPGNSAELLRLLTQGVEACRKPLPGRLVDQTAAAKSIHQVAQANEERTALQRNILFPYCLTNFHTVWREHAAAESERRTMILACAIERFRRQHGTLPESFVELTPAYLADIPADPCANDTLRYLRQSTGYVIYSVGFNQVDDGGDVDPTVDRHAKDAGIRILFLTEAPNSTRGP
jgi:hypothetical protein